MSVSMTPAVIATGTISCLLRSHPHRRRSRQHRSRPRRHSFPADSPSGAAGVRITDSIDTARAEAHRYARQAAPRHTYGPTTPYGPGLDRFPRTARGGRALASCGERGYAAAA
jgi:hypothetical protein